MLELKLIHVSKRDPWKGYCLDFQAATMFVLILVSVLVQVLK